MPFTAKQIAPRALALSQAEQRGVRIKCDKFQVSPITLRQELYATHPGCYIRRTVDTLDVFAQRDFAAGTLLEITPEYIEKIEKSESVVAEGPTLAPSQLVVFNTDVLTDRAVLALRVLLTDKVYETVELVGITEDDFASRFSEHARAVTVAPTKRGIVLV